jgi:hypothetical protein
MKADVGELLIGFMEAVFGLLFLIALYHLRHELTDRRLWPQREDLRALALWLSLSVLSLAGIVALVVAVGPRTLAIGVGALFAGLALYSLALPIWSYRRSRRGGKSSTAA